MQPWMGCEISVSLADYEEVEVTFNVTSTPTSGSYWHPGDPGDWDVTKVVGVDPFDPTEEYEQQDIFNRLSGDELRTIDLAISEWLNNHED